MPKLVWMPESTESMESVVTHHPRGFIARAPAPMLPVTQLGKHSPQDWV